jgi:hypothetical protein
MKSSVWLAVSLVVGGITLLSVHRILDPWSYASRVNVEKGNMAAEMGDLYSPWVGTRELLLRHRNPYGPNVTRQIQMVFYGHPIKQTYDDSGRFLVNEQRFAYPVYLVFLLAPFVKTNFTDLHRWARPALAAFAAISLLLSLRILNWRLTWTKTTALILFILSSPQLVQGLRFEQLALLVGFLLVAAAWCVQKNYLVTAGVLLALSTIKPQMSIVPLCWFAVWAGGDWSRRWRIAASFFATLTAFIAGGQLLLPGWIGYFVTGLSAYRKYAPTSSLLRIALGDTVGSIVGAIIFLGLVHFAWRNRKTKAASPEFTLVFAAFLMGAILVFPLFTPFNQVMLILPTLFLLRDWKAVPPFSRFVFIAIVSWPWITELALLIFPPQLDSPSQLPLLPSFMVSFFPLFLPLMHMAKRRNASPAMAPRDLQPTLNS